VAASFHLPTEPVLFLFGIDQIMDMGRTGVNVLGNCLATMAIARWEGEIMPTNEQPLPSATQCSSGGDGLSGVVKASGNSVDGSSQSVI
jgi:Na+/H+-dicarboxylate symporter